MSVEDLFNKYRTLTDGDIPAAAMLTLAHANLHGQAGMPDILSVREAAERLSVSQQTVYDMIAAGKLAHKRVGAGRGAIRIKAEDLFREPPRSDAVFLASPHLAPATRGRGRPKTKSA